MYTRLSIDKNPTAPSIPQEGFYVTLYWMFGDADGDTEQTAGPIPTGRRDMVIELANVLENMVDLYADSGKGGYEGYETVPGIAKWFPNEEFDCDDDDTDEDFDCDNDNTDKNDPDQTIRTNLELEIQYTPANCGCIATLTGFDVFWQDGKTTTKYEVTLS